MKRFLQFVCCFLFGLSFQSFNAQQMKVTGHVIDTSGKVALRDVNVMAVRLKDSLLLKFTRTNQQGDFTLTNFPADTFSLIVEHPDFEPKSYFIFGNENNSEINIPNIRLNMKTKELEEVVIYANKNPIYFKGDTLIYVADSFKVGQNAVVEDLLKKLPGLTIDQNGKITSQGKEISQVLVDGDEFFGSDPTIATKNLAAKGVESVAVYEKKNENAKAGENDKIQVLDLRLKEDAKKGYFGKASAASDFALNGTQKPFYESELLFNSFSSKRKISAFFLGSNTPRSNFGWGDMNKFGLENERNNSGMSFWDQSSQNNTSGLPQTIKAGIYYSDKFGKTGKVGFNYAFNDNRLTAKTSSQTQYFLQDSSYYTRDSANNSSINQSHRLNANVSAKIDSLTYFEIKPNLHFDKGITDNISMNSFRNNSFQEYLFTRIENSSEATGISSNSEALLRKKFKKPTRQIDLKYKLSYSSNSSEGKLISASQYSTFTDSLDQKKLNNNGSTSHIGILTYTEPLAAKWRTQIEYLYEFGKSRQDKKAYNRGDGTYSDLVTSLSNNFDNRRNQHRGTAQLIYENSKHFVSGGLGFRTISIKNHNLVTDTIIPQLLNNFLPQFSYRYRPAPGMNLSFNYSTNSAPPSINDLQPVPDNSNPNRIQKGNPNLQPNYMHTVNFNFNRWQALTGRYVWTGFYASYTNNDFANSTTYNNFGQTESQTVNVDGNISSSVWAGGGIPVFKKKLSINPNSNFSYFKYTNFINSQTNVTQTMSASVGLDFRLELDSLEVNFGNNFTYNNPKSSLNSISNLPYSSQQYYARMEWTLPLHFVIKADATYTINSRRAQGFNRNIFIINAEFRKMFFKTENLWVSIMANDILNQNINVLRQVNGNQITDNFTKIISRYFLLKVTYKFNNNKTKEDEFQGWH
ncbi:MAG: hypothetical protein RL264_2461 [Bacteroidota bacterium]|jgi:5-hydroxyisourate hydrolase-like protein (transthyretin family)/outer membrane receptor protein involved in Fe transport